MKSHEAFKQVIHNVNTKYGAPMGRPNKGERPTDQRVFSRIVRLDGGGYDRGGVYWGIGPTLRVEYTTDLSYINFYRDNHDK